MPTSVEPICAYLAEATPEHARQTEASIVKLRDGRLFLAWTDFTSADWADHGPARIMGRWSSDGGANWSEPVVVQDNIGRLNVMIASLIQSPTGRILLCFHRKDVEWTECHLMVKWSDDDARSWSEPVQITYGHPRYWCGTNDRFIRLETGRILLPAGDLQGLTAFYSDDDGETWTYSTNWIRPEGDSFAEPVVVELSDGTVLMLIRSRSGFIKFAKSRDGGESWNDWDVPYNRQPPAPYSPSNCKRVPGSEDLLLIWNCAGGHRIPLTGAVSSDGGWSWGHLRHLERLEGIPPLHTYAYPSIALDGELVHVTYWDTFHPEPETVDADEYQVMRSGAHMGKRLFHRRI